MSDIEDDSRLVWAEESAYYHGLGRLIHWFAIFEATLNFEVALFVVEEAMRDDSGNRVREPGAKVRAAVRATAQGGRYAGRRDSLKRLLRVSGASETIQSEINRIFSHIGQIQALRDSLAHHGAIMHEDKQWRTENFASASELSKVIDRRFCPNDLEDAALDLSAAWLGLPMTIGLRFWESQEPEDLEARIRSWRVPWHYKP